MYSNVLLLLRPLLTILCSSPSHPQYHGLPAFWSSICRHLPSKHDLQQESSTLPPPFTFSHSRFTQPHFPHSFLQHLQYNGPVAAQHRPLLYEVEQIVSWCSFSSAAHVRTRLTALRRTIFLHSLLVASFLLFLTKTSLFKVISPSLPPLPFPVISRETLAMKCSVSHQHAR